MSPTLGMVTDHDNFDDDVQTVNTNDTRAYMTPDGKCPTHPWVELRGKDLASGQVYQRESCPECNRQHETTMDDKRQRKLELDRRLQALGNENSNSGDGGGIDGSRGSVDRDRVSESHSMHPQPYRPPLPPQTSSSSIDYSYPQRQSSPRPPTAAGMNNMMSGPQLVPAPPGPIRTSSLASAASSSNQYQQQQQQHIMDVITNGNGPLNNYANGTPTGTLPFSPHSNPFDPQYLAAAAAANAYHHANSSPAPPTPSQHLQQATRHDNQNQNNDSLLWKLLQDKEDELKEVRKTLQETQRQFQEQSLLATKLQTTLDQVQASFEQERLLIRLQIEKESQQSLSSQQQEVFQRQLQWMENNNNNSTTNINTDNRAAQNLIKPPNDVGIGSSQHFGQSSIHSSGPSLQKQQQNDFGTGLSQHSEQNSIHSAHSSTLVSIGKMSISNDEEELQHSVHSNMNDREVINTEAMVDAVSSSNVVSMNNDSSNITSRDKKKGEKKYPWTETTKVSPGREKRPTTFVADDDDDDNEKDDTNETNSGINTFKIPTKSNSKKKLYPSIDETFMGSDVTAKEEAFTDGYNDLSRLKDSMPNSSSPSPKSTIREQLQQQHQQVPVDSIASRNTAQTINNMAETPTMNNTGRNSGKKTSINNMAETPTMNNTAARNFGKKTLKNDSSDRFEPIYVQQKVDEEEEEVLANTSDFDPPTDDDRSLGQTVASSTYGDDRMKVMGKTLLDPYGDKGTFTGVVLRNTGMPHGQGKMVYEEDLRVFDGEWRHGRWHGYGRASFSNGDSYEGEYKFDQRHGTGLYRWNDGRVYDGQFSEDKRHGKGKFTWPDGAVYEGFFVNGQRQGHYGNYTFADGGQYDGSWKGGRYDGFGTCTWEDGRRYRGAWRNGMAHGHGAETYPNGSIRHEGQWIDDEPVRVEHN